MIIIAIVLGCLIGALIGINMPMISYTYSGYLAIAIIAALDSVFGGIASTLRKNFDLKIFVTGFFGNAILSILLTYLGQKLNVDIYLAAIVVFVGRMFNNLAIIRRYYTSLCDYKKGIGTKEVIDTIKKLMNKIGITIENREIVKYALEKSEKENTNVVALMLENGRVITGKESELLSASSALLLNTIKDISGIPDDVYLLSPTVLESILKLKQKTSYKRNYSLNLPEVLIVLSICSQTNPIISKTLEAIDKLRNLEAHSSYIISLSEMQVFKSLGINLTCEPKLLGYE